MIKASYLWICVALLAFSCASSEKETKRGLKYSIVKAGDGEIAKPNEIVVVNFELRDSKDSVWTSSYKMKVPAAVQIPDTSRMKEVDIITEMISTLKKGDSVKTSLTVTDFFAKLVRGPVPPKIDSTLTLTYRMRVEDIMEREKFVQWRTDLITKRDDQMIADFLKENNLTAEKDTSGLYVIKHSNASGPKPAMDNCVEVKYEGKFMSNGMTFDGNDHISFSLTQVIKAWQYGFTKLSKGDSATFLVPSRLGYGERGFYGIPGDAVLMFNVTLYDFKAGYDQATNSCK